MKIPQSLSNAVEEEPERFIKYLDIEKIYSSNNPRNEFLIQFSKGFGSKQGLNLWQYVLKKYKILNELYKNDSIQDKLPDKFKGSLKRKEVKIFFEEYIKNTQEKQVKLEVIYKKPVHVGSYSREGKKIRDYYRTKGNEYSDRELRFILARKNYPIKQLTNEFNRAFEKMVTIFGIRDKRYRLLRKKI